MSKVTAYRTRIIKSRSLIVAAPIKIALIWYVFPKFDQLRSVRM